MKDIILVDEQDNPVGTAEKMQAHEQALCHRAFSVFVVQKVNNKWQVLIHQRHPGKYHCGGLWTNTCCSHPRPGEETVAAGERRLKEEMGLSLPLKEVGVFHYIATFENGLTENEVDHVLVGSYDNQSINIDETEIASYAWLSVDDIKKELTQQPQKYTPWFEQAFNLAITSLGT